MAGPVEDEAAQPGRPRRWPRIVAAGSLLIAVALLIAWSRREAIADDVLAGQLEAMGLPATYRVEHIGPDRQVLSNLVIGDPARPDLTVERVEARMRLSWGLFGIGRITLVKPRLRGAYRHGRLSFGILDKVLFAGSDEPFRLPDLDVTLVDGRARLDTDFGPVGIKLEGKGPLRVGFDGIVAATAPVLTAPRLSAGGCRGAGASLYGKVSVRGEKLRFAGPLRLAALDCPALALNTGPAALRLDARFGPRLDAAEGDVVLEGGRIAYGRNRLAGSGGRARFTWRDRGLTARYLIKGRGLDTPQARLAGFAFEGMVRAQDGFSRVEAEGRAAGAGLGLGAGLDARLASVQHAAGGTLAAPLLGRLRGALRREQDGSSLSVSHVVRLAGGRLTLVAPEAVLRGGSGDPLISVSRLQLTYAEAGSTGSPPTLSGNFATGGRDMPRIAGRVERGADNRLTARIAMADYAAGSSRLAVPRLALVKLAGSDRLALAGEARMSGALPGGELRGLVLPLSGDWSPAGGLALWRSCVPLRFDRLALASLRVERRGLTLCPPAGGGGILRAGGPDGLRIAAGMPSLAIAGRLGETPLRVASGPIGFAVPGNLSARRLAVELGPQATASRFLIADLAARIGGDVAGSFSGSDVLLAAVPLDLRGASGRWRYADGRLAITESAFRLEDRQPDARFAPLAAEGATLSLFANRIAAEAVLREPASRREVVRTLIGHDLSTARGHADLAVAGVSFDKAVQPDTLTRLARGVIANARGTLRGQGRIDWNPRAVTSSGRFTTDSLDFAAAFGPVKGASGTIVFTDLLGMVTAPHQQLRIASINPGIEVEDGTLSYEMRPGMVVAVNGARWPFMDGALTLQPTQMVMGGSETRRFTLMVEALDAAKLVQRMELANINASGVFDGRLPLVFDQDGGRIEGGMLLSRPPGGNVSYVGELTYKDLSSMGNFAFDALRSVDYRRMQIDLDGALQGEIVTRVAFEGLSQGAAAKRNFLTQKIAKLPIRFQVNIRAPFFGLFGSFRSLYDPSFVADPRTLGLLGADGRPLRNIQPPESGKRP